MDRWVGMVVVRGVTLMQLCICTSVLEMCGLLHAFNESFVKPTGKREKKADSTSGVGDEFTIDIRRHQEQVVICDFETANKHGSFARLL